MTRSSAPPSASRMPSRNLGKELGNNLGEEEDAMTILLSCFSARELNTRTRNCPRRTTTYNRVDGDRSYCVTHSARTSIARRQRRDREYEVCQTKSPSGLRPNRLRTRVTSKERDESAAASNERLPESQMCFLRTLQSQSVGKGSVHIRLHLTCPFLSRTKDDVRRQTSCYMHGWDGWIDPGGVVLLKE